MPSPKIAVYQDGFQIASELVMAIEADTTPLSRLVLKAKRLALLLNESDYVSIFEYETSGYPFYGKTVPDGVAQLAKKSGRIVFEYDDKTQEDRKLVEIRSLTEIEESIAQLRTQLAVPRRPPQDFFENFGESVHYERLTRDLASLTRLLNARLTFIHSYAVRKYFQLKFSSVASDVFSRIRDRVDTRIGEIIPDGLKQFSSAYDNLLSSNPEDWANAVHTCRRILAALADALFPAQEIPKSKESDGGRRDIQLGKENYVNRLICYIEDNTDSGRFVDIVGSHLKFIGERLGSIMAAAHKGTHATVRQEEADRYVVYTYMIVGDILSLKQAGRT